MEAAQKRTQSICGKRSTTLQVFGKASSRTQVNGKGSSQLHSCSGKVWSVLQTTKLMFGDSLVVVFECEVVEEGAGLKEEEVELAGEGSTEEGESMQRAESSDVVELFRLALRAFIQGCSRHLAADIRLLNTYTYTHKWPVQQLGVAMDHSEGDTNQHVLELYKLCVFKGLERRGHHKVLARVCVEVSIEVGHGFLQGQIAIKGIGFTHVN